MKTLDDLIPADVTPEQCQGLPEVGEVLEVEGVRCTVLRRVIANGEQLRQWALHNEQVDPRLIFAMSDAFRRNVHNGAVCVCEIEAIETSGPDHAVITE